MSYVLRHNPESIGIKLNQQGWTSINSLIEKLNITIDELNYVVENNSKKRFKFNEEKLLIRASQGHSVHVDLGISQKTPPAVLYHGTSTKNYKLIKTTGILKMNRNHVHLSSDQTTATMVGKRHGDPIVLIIDTQAMNADGILFFKSDNGVWLTNNILPKYIISEQY